MYGQSLRRQALEGGKTLSRKAQSRQSSIASSPAGSRANSRAGSRIPSRQPSDEDIGDSSSENETYEFHSSTKSRRSKRNRPRDANRTQKIDADLNRNASIDGMYSSVEDEPRFNWEAELRNRMEQILDRKRSSGQGREADLASYVYILRTRYSYDTITKSFTDLTAAFLRSIRNETSEKESTLALKAIAISVLTDTSAASYDMCVKHLKSTITDTADLPVKTEAIHTLSVATFFGGASTTDTEHVMAFLLQIIESDGANISAEDDAKVVTAAIDAWGFLATQLEDVEDTSEEAVEAMSEQLESSQTSVQVSAGENIALLYEKSWTDLESDEEVSDTEDATTHGDSKVKRYDAYRNTPLLLDRLEQLSSVSSKRLSKKDRKYLHLNFVDIRNSVEHPTWGPRYSTALQEESDQALGSRLVVKVGKKTVMVINRWWKLHRWKALKRVLQGGFLEHYERNEVVIEALPVFAEGR